MQDLELAEAVRKTGPRDWANKQQMLSSGRSAGAIRKRWTKLEEDADLASRRGGLTAGESDRVRVWNTKTLRLLAGASAPRRENLQKYLKEHEDMEVYSGQDQAQEDDDSDGDEFEVAPDAAWLKSVEIGTKLEAKDDSDQSWYDGKVVETESDDVKIHYIGFAGKYDVWIPRSLDWLRPVTVPGKPRPAKAKPSASSASGEGGGGERTQLLQQVAKLKSLYADSAGYQKACPDCGRVFTHPPAFASHVGSRLCKEDTQALVAKSPGGYKREPLTEGDAAAAFVRPSPRGSPMQRSAVPESDPRSWSAEEDEALLQLVHNKGAADWVGKAAAFRYNRSASAVRKRWFKLQEDAADSMAQQRSQGQLPPGAQEQPPSIYDMPSKVRFLLKTDEFYYRTDRFCTQMVNFVAPFAAAAA